jgi:hypothetical protein
MPLPKLNSTVNAGPTKETDDSAAGCRSAQWTKRESSALPSLEDILRANPFWLDEAVDTVEAARMTGRPVTTLQTLRVRGGGPVFIQHARKVSYRRRDLIQWMTAGLRSSTAGNKLR